MIKNWTIEQIKYITEHYNELNYTQMSERVNKSPRSVQHMLKKLKLPYTRQNLGKLLEPELDSFYWMGFIMADGCFSHYKDGLPTSLQIEISDKDIKHLEKAAEFFNVKIYKSSYNKNSYANKGNDFQRSFMVSLRIRDATLIPKICNKFDIHRNKTKNPPNFERISQDCTSNQMLALIIGYIDGDGCISKTNKGSEYFRIKCSKEWGVNLQWIHDYLNKIFNHIFISNASVVYEGKYVTLSRGNRDVLNALRTFIVSNNLPALNRKWKIIKPLENKDE